MIDLEIFKLIFVIIWNWWWMWLPLVLFFIFRPIYYYWLSERLFNKIPWITLEIKIPREIAKTPRATEQIMHGFHGVHDPLNWKEKWIDGRMLLWLSLEIVGIDGVVHFYIHLPKQFRTLVESNIYSQYSQAEIQEVEDYTRLVPKDIPNKSWDMWGTDFVLTKADAYPIRTYRVFETEMIKEEKRIDPLSSLLELMGSLSEGEQIWLQILARPIIDERKWKKEGEEIVYKIMGKKTGEKKEALLSELSKGVASILVYGQTPEALKEEKTGLEALMLRLSPGEQEVIKAIEENIAKFGFEANLRFIYLAKSEVFNKPKGVASFMGVFKQFSTHNLNGFKPDKKSKTKVVYFMVNRRNRFRKRKLFRYYKKRFFPPHRKPFVMSTEELATIYHFPGEMVAPTLALPRVEARKGGAPITLPVEE